MKSKIYLNFISHIKHLKSIHETMLKFSFLDSQPDIHPLAAIFQIQNSIFNSIKDSNNEMHQLVLSFIPILDKQRMSQLTSSLKKHEHIKDIIDKFHFPKRFDTNIIDAYNLTIKDPTIFPESLIVSISFASVIWYCDSSSRNTKDFEDLISFLSGLLNCNQKMNFIISYAFKKLLKGAVNSSSFKWHPTVFRVVFSHIFVNTSLDTKIYKQLINFFKIVVDYNHSDSMNEMMKLITTIFKDDRKIINWDEIQLVIFLFMPFINSLDDQALSFISLLSYKTKSPALVDTFILLPSLLLNSLDFDDDDHQFYQPVSQFGKINVRSLPISFSHSSSFSNGMENPNFSSFEELQTGNQSHLNENTIIAVEKVADCINKAAMTYREQFFLTFGKMFTILKNSNRYIQTCTAFVLLMEYTFKSVPIDLFLSILKETVLFQPEYNIYALHGLDKMINYLRNRVFQMVIENSPPSISSFFEKTSCYPFLLTEHLNRLLFLQPDIFYEYFLDEKNADIFIQSALHLYCLENESAFDDSDKIISKNDRKSMLETYDVKKARNDNFLFLMKITSKTDLFSFENFASGFLWFMLEDDISYYILYFLKKVIANFKKKENCDISATVDFIMRILLKIISVIKNDKSSLFNDLAVSLADSIQDGLIQNSTIFPSFESAFSLFFDILDLIPSKSLLESCFTMIEIYNQIERWRPLNPFHYRILLNAIQKIEGENISDLTFAHLYNMLSLSSNLKNKNVFHIKKPSILPLLFFVFVQAKKEITFLNNLNQLCDFSVYNAAACHDGGIDAILLDYLINSKSKNKDDEKVLVNYCGITFSLYFTFDQLKTVIFPLLVKIFQIKSDNSVCAKLSNIIGEKIDQISLISCEKLIEVITQMKNSPVPKFRIGTFKPTLKFFNIPKTFFINSKFIIKFDLILDAESISSSNTSINLFSIIDENDENSPEIRLLTDQMSLILCQKVNGIEHFRHVVRIMPPNGWNTYEFHFETNENTFSLCTFINEEEMNYFQNMTFPHFVSEKVSVSLGGYTKILIDDWLNVEFGYISHFAVATTANTNIMENTKNEPIKTENTCNDNIYTEFKDYFILENMRYNVICIMSDIDCNSNFFVYSEKKSGIKAFINFANLENRNNLLFYLVKGNFINSLCQNFFGNFTDALYPNYVKLIFDILAQIIPITQHPLNYLDIDSMMHYLSSSVDHLDSDLFFCVTAIFDEISSVKGDRYSNRWFELLIINFWLWSRMKPDDFKRVLYYFSHQLVFSHPDYFRRISYFSLLLNQYYLMFCMKDDGVTHEYQVSDFTVFRKEYSFDDIEDCRKIFECFLNRIILLKVEQTDIETLFSHLFSSSSFKTILTMLHLLVAIPSTTLRQSQNASRHLTMLHNFFSEKYKDHLSIEIIEQVLILIHKLAGDDIHQHFLSAAHELKLLYSDDNYNKLNIIEFFKSISHYVYEYPNISIFLCILALNWYKSTDLDKTDRDNINSLVCSILLLICNKKDSIALFEFCSFWYIWPILLAYTLESNLRRSISFFLSKMLIYSPSPISEMDKIIDICNLITSTHYAKINLAFEFMKELCGIELSLFGGVDLNSESTDTQIIRHSILRIFYSIFLHFSSLPINNNIYVSKQIIDSEMCTIRKDGLLHDYETFLIDENDQLKLTPLTTPQEFEQLICADFTGYKMNFKVRLNKEGEWNDKEKAIFILSLLQKCKVESFDNKIETVYIIIQYFMNKESLPIDRMIIVQSSLKSVFEPLTDAYGKQFNQNISTFSKVFHQLMENMYDLLFNNKNTNSEAYVRRSHLLLNEEVSRITILTDITAIPPSIVKRSNILASDFCPHLMKRTFQKETVPVIQRGQPILELKCARVKLNSVKKYIFRLYKDSFCLSGHKTVSLDDVTMILARKRSSMIELSQFGSDSGSKDKEREKESKEKDTSIEIFTVDGRSFLIDFFNVENSTVVRSFLEVPLPSIQFIQKSSSSSPASDVFSIPKITQKWAQGLISNFDYLMMLNVFSGRTFNDEKLYPLFPSILADFDNHTMIRDIAHQFRYNNSYVKKKNLAKTLMELQMIKPEFYYSSRMIMDPSMYIDQKQSIRSLSLPINTSSFVHYLPKARSSDEIVTDNASTTTINNSSDVSTSQHRNSMNTNDTDDNNAGTSQNFGYTYDDDNDNDSDTIKLPHWASSPFEFVYKHRILLESKSVNEYLGEWVFDVFGPKMKGNFGHRQLFNTSHHPSRCIRPLFDITDKPTQHFKIKNAKIVSATTVLSGPIEFKFLFLLNNGSLISMVINTSTFSNPSLKIERRSISNNLAGRFAMSSFRGNSLVLARDDRKVFNFKESNIDTSNLANMANFNYYNNLSRNLSGPSSMFYLATDTDFFFASQNGATFCPDSTTIATVKFSTSLFYYPNVNSGNNNGNNSAQTGLDFRYGFNYLYSNEPSSSCEIYDRSNIKIIWRSDEKIISIDASWRFKVVAFATADGFLHVGSIRNGSEVTKYDLKTFAYNESDQNQVRNIKITRNFGFIVVSLLDRFLIFSVNGDFIKQSKLISLLPSTLNKQNQTNEELPPKVTEKVIRLFPLNKRGIDFIAYQNDIFEIKIFEAFYPDKIQKICFAGCPVLCVEYDPATNGYLIVRESGRISLISSCV